MKHQRCPNLSPAVLSTNAQAEKNPFISILSWYDEKRTAQTLHIIASQISFLSLPMCVLPLLEELEYSLLWSPASHASLQHYPGRLVNTGNTNPPNTSLLCLEDCHDNTQWAPREMWCLLGGSILRYAQALPSWPRACSCHGGKNKEPLIAETEFVKDSNSLLALSACLNPK